MVEKILKADNGHFCYDWDYIETIPEFSVLKTCEQNPKWHKEGSVWNHTKLVCEEMLNRQDYNKPLLIAALFHDIGKGVTTEFKKNNWHAYGHEIEGEKITRRLLWDEGYEFREEVCALVRWHMEPLRVFESKDYLTRILNLSKVVTIADICTLKDCDICGSIREEAEITIIEDFAKLEELKYIAQTLNCYREPSDIITNGNFSWKTFFDDKKLIQLYMMIGLPGSGKDTFIKNHLLKTNHIITSGEKMIMGLNRRKTAVLSRDDIRVELGYCKDGEKAVLSPEMEKKVSKVFDEKLQTAIDKDKTIVINNINLKKKYRTELVNKLRENYRVHVVYIYVEADGLDTNIKRRENQIKPEVFSTMITNFDWPTEDEYDKFLIVKNDGS